MICPKTGTTCKYNLRELDDDLCSWCEQIEEIRGVSKRRPKRNHRKEYEDYNQTDDLYEEETKQSSREKQEEVTL